MANLVTRKGGLELLADLERAGGLTPTALTLDPDTPYDQWAAIGGLLGSLHRSVAWIAGDWVEHGERCYGEKYAQAVDETGLAPQTLMNYASVCRHIPPARRRASLPFSSHALVAKMKPREQDRWLKRAEKEGWTRRDLASQIKGQQPTSGGIRELAQAVWSSALPVEFHSLEDGLVNPADAARLKALQLAAGYFVPAEPMQRLSEAL